MQDSTPKKLASCLLLMALVLTASACRDQGVSETSEPAAATAARINGTVTYRERMALSHLAELEVTLEDVSRRDVAARVLARQTISNPGQVPIRFELRFAPTDIDQRMSYSLRARIHDGGKLAFVSDTHTPVLTRGAGREAHMTLVRAQGAPSGQEAAAATEPGSRSGPATAARSRERRMIRTLAWIRGPTRPLMAGSACRCGESALLAGMIWFA